MFPMKITKIWKLLYEEKKKLTFKYNFQREMELGTTVKTI